MTVVLYLDVHIPRAILIGLRSRGVDVLTAQEDDHARAEDPNLLDRSTALGRVLVSSDADLLAEAHRRQAGGGTFAGLVHAHPLRVSIGRCVEDLELIAKASDPEDMRDRVEYLPL